MSNAPSDDLIDAAWSAWAEAWTTMGGGDPMRAALAAVLPRVRAEERAATLREEKAIRLGQQHADIEQVYSLIDCSEREWEGDSGPLAKGARLTLAHLRAQLALRFGEPREASGGAEK